MAKSVRTVSDTEFVAEALEDLADHVSSEQAEILKNAAAIYRQSPPRRFVRVHEEQEDLNQAAARTLKEATEKV